MILIIIVFLCILIGFGLRTNFPKDDFFYYCKGKYQSFMHSLPCRNIIKSDDVPSQVKICCISHDTRLNQDYVEEYRKRNAEACARQGIDFKFYTTTDHDDRPVYWRKMYLVRDALKQDYDYVIRIDSDAVITDRSTLYDMLQLYDGPNVDMMVSLDPRGMSYRSYLNAGFFIAKKQALDLFDNFFLKDIPDGCWIQGSNVHQIGLFAMLCYEQGSINRAFFKFPGRIVPIERCHVSPWKQGPESVVVHYLGKTNKRDGMTKALPPLQS